MKQFSILITFFFTIITFGQQATGVAVYKKIFQQPKMNLDTIAKLDTEGKTFLKKSIEGIDEVISGFEYQLNFTATNACFFKRKQMSVDDGSGFKQEMADIVSKTKGTYYYNSATKSAIQELDFFGETILVITAANENNWVLTNQKKQINNTLCYKATKTKIVDTRRGKVKRNIIAWYDPSVNLPFGPDGYFGLPGLIVQVVEHNVTTYLQSITFGKQHKIKFPTKGKKMTATEYMTYSREKIATYRR